MILIPAIDIFKGKVVRLLRGEKDKVTIYDEDPVRRARFFLSYKVKLIHVVDLDAAFGEGDNIKVIEDILKLGASIEVGGGIREISKIERLLSLGVKRVIIGTKAIDEKFLDEVISKFADKIAVSVDVLDGKIRCEGWRKDSDVNYLDFLRRLEEKNVKYVIYTDISRDGTMRGINIEGLKSLTLFKNIRFIVSGGVASIDDLKILKENFPFLEGVILGKAIYEKRIDLKEALTIFD